MSTALSIVVEVRWRDLDPLGHVNNAVMVSFFEVARLELFRRHLGLGDSIEIDWVVARVEADYRRPILLGETVEVACWPTALGRSSFTLDYRVEANGELAAEGRSIQVHLEAGKPAPVPEATRAGLQALMNPS